MPSTMKALNTKLNADRLLANKLRATGILSESRFNCRGNEPATAVPESLFPFLSVVLDWTSEPEIRKIRFDKLDIEVAPAAFPYLAIVEAKLLTR